MTTPLTQTVASQLKRTLSDGAYEHCSASCAKRPRHDGCNPRASPSPSNPPLQLPPLTEEALTCLQQSLHKHNSGDYQALSCLEKMAALPTPRSGLTSRGRSRRSARSSGSRTPSPSKKPSPQTYRTRNLYHANIRIEVLPDLPSPINAQVRDIVGPDSWQDRVEDQMEPHLKNCAARYHVESKRNLLECALEGDWKTSLHSLLRELTSHDAGVLKVQGSEKVWHPSLKPTSSIADDMEDEDDGRTRTPRSAQIALPAFIPNDAAFTAPVPILSPSTPSIAPTASTEAADPYHVSTPKPDITIGLAHTGFKSRQQKCLIDHQASGSILSDPHAADMGIRFPFLVIEAKGLSLNGSLVGAQNQAAVSGACMLAILQDLHNHADGYTDPAANAELVLDDTPALCFSITTAGAIHEVNVHFMHEGCFHMYSLEVYNTKFKPHTTRFIHLLHQILEWGKGKYKSSLVKELGRSRSSKSQMLE